VRAARVKFAPLWQEKRHVAQFPAGSRWDLGGPLPGFAGTRFAGHDNKGVNLQGRWYNSEFNSDYQRIGRAAGNKKTGRPKGRRPHQTNLTKCVARLIRICELNSARDQSAYAS
jgi:hypothetical protein